MLASGSVTPIAVSRAFSPNPIPSSPGENAATLTIETTTATPISLISFVRVAPSPVPASGHKKSRDFRDRLGQGLLSPDLVFIFTRLDFHL
ncbi:hypothetical protein [Cohnella hongkongensis]|uniref:Uncharacterized protein n=1 Tax=Cohnella hongkongensis TaxID=178337 RepID=A0ABV9FAE6_9BACL